MTITLSHGGEVIAEVTDIEVSPSFEKATRATSDAIDALTQGMGTLRYTVEESTLSFEELKARLDRLSRPQKPKLTDRQIYKTMRMRGIH
jgi:hypothetical protein